MTFRERSSMKRRLKKVISLVLVVVIAVGLAACNSNSGAGAGNPATVQAATTDQAEAVDEARADQAAAEQTDQAEADQPEAEADQTAADQATNGKRVYFAGPLFNEAERAYNLKIVEILEAHGYEVFLPQRDGLLAPELEGKTEAEKIDMIFTKDTDEVLKADILFMMLDGRVPDEGACIELGIAYASGKRCYDFSFSHALFSLILIIPLWVSLFPGHRFSIHSFISFGPAPFMRRASTRSAPFT